MIAVNAITSTIVCAKACVICISRDRAKPFLGRLFRLKNSRPFPNRTGRLFMSIPFGGTYRCAAVACNLYSVLTQP